MKEKYLIAWECFLRGVAGWGGGNIEKWVDGWRQRFAENEGTLVFHKTPAHHVARAIAARVVGENIADQDRIRAMHQIEKALQLGKSESLFPQELDDYPYARVREEIAAILDQMRRTAKK